MTEQNITEDTAEAPDSGDTTENPAEEDSNQPVKNEDPDEGTSQVRKARKEAANYRERAREAETRAETLQARVEALEWAEVERHLPKNAPRLEGLKKLGLELEEVKDDHGSISPEKVHEAVTTAAELVGVTLNPQPHMPHEGRSPNPTALMDQGAEEQLKQALGIPS